MTTQEMKPLTREDIRRMAARGWEELPKRNALTVIFDDGGPGRYWDGIVDLDAISWRERKWLGEEQERIARKWREEGSDFGFWLPGQREKECLRIIERYSTPFDANLIQQGYGRKQFEKAYEHARKGYVVTISQSGVWGAHEELENGHRGVTISSYETLGLHGCTSDLIWGWLVGGASIIDYRASKPSEKPILNQLRLATR